MPLVYPNMQMSEVVEEHPSLIPVINRFGIRLGLGDKSVKAICEEYQLDADFLLTVINTFLNEEYFPEKKLQTFHTSQIIDYLTKTNLYYQRYQIPNIERHLGSFISMSTPRNNTLNLIGKFFSSFKEELTSRIEKDDRVWFPYCLSLSEKLKDYQSSGQLEALHLGTEQRLEDPIEALLADLKSISYQALKNTMLRRGDTLVIKSLDRLSRNKCDIKHELQYFQQSGVRLKVIDLPTTMIDFPEGQEWVMEMVNNILIEVLGTIAEQERTTIRQRQADGIAAAKQKGVALGRPKAQKPDNWEEVIAEWQAGKITAAKAMELTGTKRTTFYKLLSEKTADM